MQSLWHDLRHGLRTLVKKPGFTLIAVITLALGIGANAAIFSVVNAVLLRPLPYPNAERLVAVSENSLEASDISVAYPDYLDWQTQQSVFEEMSARMPTGGVITGANEPERVIGRLVTPSFFPTLGVQPLLGRVFTEAENKPGTPPVIVISHGLWQRQFGGASDVIGKTIMYNGEPWTVIGVMPSWFDFYGRTNINNDVFVPLGYLNNLEFMQDRNSHPVRVTARMKPGVSLEQAQSQLSALSSRLAKQYPESNTGVGATTRSFLDDYVGDSRQSLRVIFAAVAFMLLIACANVASLLLARARNRGKEIGIRLALGATRRRIVCQLLTESLLLALAGAALGFLMALWTSGLASGLRTRVGGTLDLNVSPNTRVLLFTLIVSILTVLLFGVIPALRASRLELVPVLKGDLSTPVFRRGPSLHSLLVVTQVALSLVLLAGAGLFLRSLWKLQSIEKGFTRDHVLAMSLNMDLQGYDENRGKNFYAAALENVAAVPGVQSATASRGKIPDRSNRRLSEPSQ